MSAEVFPDAAHHMSVLKQPYRLVIIVNHNGGCLGGSQMTMKPRLAIFQLKSFKTILKCPNNVSHSALEETVHLQTKKPVDSVLPLGESSRIE